MPFYDRIKNIGRGEFLKDVLKLSFGTIGGRLLSLIALPLVTRIYTPDDFALLTVYLAIVNLVAVGACLRLEIAIPLARNDSDAVNLLALALISVTLISSITLIIILLLPSTLGNWLGNSQIVPYLWLVPLGIVSAGVYSTFQFWATRARRFGSIARTRIGQAAAGVLVMLSLGWLGITPFGLLLGNMLNIGAGGGSLGMQALHMDRKKLRKISYRKMKGTLHRYRRYPIYSTPEALLNIAGIQVPILLIAANNGAEVGFLFLAMQVMTAPMTLLGRSISQVYMSRAPDAYREGRLSTFTLKIMRRLTIIGIGPLLFAGIAAPFIFPWIFGSDWARSGVVVTWLVPWMFLQFIASPVSMVMFVVNKQQVMLKLTSFGFVLRTFGVAIAIYLNLPLIETFAISSGVFYATCCLTFIKAAHTNSKNVKL